VAQLSGVSSFADAGYAAAYNPTGPTPFSVGAMFRSNPADNRLQTIVGHSTNSWAINLTTLGKLQCQLGTNTSSQIISSGVYNDGNWHQVVEVYTPASAPTVTGTNSMYVDGVLDTSEHGDHQWHSPWNESGRDAGERSTIYEQSGRSWTAICGAGV
jgi:hypothetical protein